MKHYLLLLILFTTASVSAHKHNLDPCVILNKAFGKLHDAGEGSYNFDYKEKSLFKTDTTKATGQLRFTVNADSTFRQYYFTAFHIESFLKIDTVVYEVREPRKEYNVSSNLQNSNYWHCFSKFVNYKSLLDYWRDTAYTISYGGAAIINEIRCHIINIQSADERGIASLITLFIDRKACSIRKMIYKFDFMKDNQYEEIIIRDLRISNKQNMHTIKALREKEAEFQKSYKHIERPKSDRKEERLLDTLTPAPDFNLEADNGKFIRLKQVHDAKIIIVDFWYISCYPCLKLSPVLNKLAAKYKDQGVIIFGINPYDDIRKIREHKGKHEVNYTLLSSAKDIPAIYQVSSYPTLYILNEKKAIVATLQGYHSQIEEQLEKLIEKQLKE